MRSMIRVFLHSLLVVGLLGGAALAEPAAGKPAASHATKHSSKTKAKKAHKAHKARKAKHKKTRKTKPAK